MSPMAKMPGALVAQFSGETVDVAAVQVEAPIGDRPQIHGEAEERQQDIGIQLPDLPFEGRDIDGAQPTVGAFQAVQLIGHHQLDLALLRQLFHARHGFRRTAEFRPTVNDKNL